MKTLIHKKAYWCQSCRSAEMSYDGIREHLRSAHRISGRIEGRKKLRAALDMSGGAYSNTYEWLLPNGVTLVEICSGEPLSIPKVTKQLELGIQ